VREEGSGEDKDSIANMEGVTLKKRAANELLQGDERKTVATEREREREREREVVLTWSSSQTT